MTGFGSILNNNPHGLSWSPVTQLSGNSLGAVPKSPGVYALYWLSELVYVGSASNDLRDRLRDHIGHCDGDWKQPVFGFAWACTHYPLTAEQWVLDQHLKRHGRLPQYNQRNAIDRAAGA